MSKWNAIPKIVTILGILSLLLISSVDAQMNRESPSFSERIPRFTDSFLDRPTTVQPQQPAQQTAPSGMSTISLNYLAPPDLSLSAEANQTGCNQVSFIVALTPDPTQVSPAGNQAVKVRVMDEVFGSAQLVAELVLLVPASGGATSAAISFPIPPDALARASWSNEITVIVDPENSIKESNESNNMIVVTGNC